MDEIDNENNEKDASLIDTPMEMSVKMPPELQYQPVNMDEIKDFFSQVLKSIFDNPDMISEGITYTITMPVDSPVYELSPKINKTPAQVISFEEAKKRLRPSVNSEEEKSPQGK